MIEQCANAVTMIRPCRFYPNPETASDNAFQSETGNDADATSQAAQREFDQAVQSLRAAGVTVHVFDDTPSPEKPDAVFPNNWFSTHPDGRVALYPMYSPTRRRERRQDLIEELGKHYRIGEVVDYSSSEEDGLYLEGTGSLVLDYVNRIAYVSLSKRSSRELVQRFCNDFDYEPVDLRKPGRRSPADLSHQRGDVCRLRVRPGGIGIDPGSRGTGESSSPPGGSRKESDRTGSCSDFEFCR